jgi:hypothetical protein
LPGNPALQPIVQQAESLKNPSFQGFLASSPQTGIFLMMKQPGRPETENET